jgi:hypothetical protein
MGVYSNLLKKQEKTKFFPPKIPYFFIDRIKEND